MTVPEAGQDQGPVASVSGEDFRLRPQSMLLSYLMKETRNLSEALLQGRHPIQEDAASWLNHLLRGCSS